MKKKNSQPHTLVIGAGSGGLTVAIGLAGFGKKVVLVEADQMGGECTNSGCVPSKALIHAAHALPSEEAMKYVREKIEEIRDEETKEEIEKHGIKVVIGRAKFISDSEVVVVTEEGEQHFKPKHIVISTGSSPRTLDIPGLPEDKVLTNNNIFQLKEIPKKLAVIGVGPIGCELAQAFRRLGTEVHVIYRGHGVLGNEDPMSAVVVQEQMEQDGVNFHWNIDKMEFVDGSLELRIRNQELRKIDGLDGVLIAIGRVPNLDSLDLDKTSIDYSPKGIEVDENYKTSVPHIYAIGDVIEGENFTHLANAQGRVVVQKIALGWLPTKTIRKVPRVTYTQPEIASAGMFLSEVEVMDEKLVTELVVTFGSTDRGKTDSIQKQHVVVYAEKLTGKILRVSIVAENAGEMLSYFALAIQQNLSLWKLYRVILPYPTLSLAFKKLADNFVRNTFANLKQDLIHFVSIKGKAWLKATGPKFLALIFWGALISYSRTLMNQRGLDFAGLTNYFAELIGDNWYGPLLYFAIYFLRPLILFPASLLAILAGFVFGLGKGYLYGLIAGTASMTLPYLFGYWFANGNGRAKTKGLDKYLKPLVKQPFQTVLIMRFLLLPYDLVNFVVGRAKVPASAAFGATLVGNLVGTLSLVALGASLEGDIGSGEITLNPWILVFSIAVLALSLVGSKFLKKKFK